MASEPIYKNIEALEPLKRLVNEVADGLADKNRTIDTSSMPEVLGAALGAGVGGVASFAALYFLGTTGLSAIGISTGLATAGALVGSGAVAGVFVLAAPVALLAVVGYAFISSKNHSRLVQAKEAIFQEVMAKHDLVNRQLANKMSLSEERIAYLNSLNVLLQAAIRDLQHDRQAA